MEINNERLEASRNVSGVVLHSLTGEQIKRISNYIKAWNRTHTNCYKARCSYCIGHIAIVNNIMDVAFVDGKVQLHIKLPRQNKLEQVLFGNDLRIVYQTDAGPWWDDFWVNLDKAEEETFTALQKASKKYEDDLNEFARRYELFRKA